MNVFELLVLTAILGIVAVVVIYFAHHRTQTVDTATAGFINESQTATLRAVAALHSVASSLVDKLHKSTPVPEVPKPADPPAPTA